VKERVRAEEERKIVGQFGLEKLELVSGSEYENECVYRGDR